LILTTVLSARLIVIAPIKPLPANTDSMVPLSIGLKHIDDLKADLDQALAKV
jgi:hypothetical protein